MHDSVALTSNHGILRTMNTAPFLGYANGWSRIVFLWVTDNVRFCGLDGMIIHMCTRLFDNDTKLAAPNNTDTYTYMCTKLTAQLGGMYDGSRQLTYIRTYVDIDMQTHTIALSVQSAYRTG